ncbi:MAG: 6-phosphofructokinase [Clostridia bacterium]|nr:6-phosphofructokinase [Clostridia bacterium]
MNILKGNAVVGQSGGPTAAINATLAGVIKGALTMSDGAIETLYGMRNGVQGLLDEDLVNLSEMFGDKGGLDEEKFALLKQTPAAALGSCRKKLPDPEKDRAFFDGLIEIFKRHNIRYFFYIGGNDSMDTVAKLTKYLATSDYEMRCVGVPKTIDNDLVGTDHTPGFGSAAKYIAATMQEIIRDCNVYKLPAVTIVEIMGRDAGWLTASAALTGEITDVRPDYIYLPEKTFDEDAFVADVKAALEKKFAVVIAVSEGVRFADGRYVGEGTQSGVADVFGHKYLAGTGKALEQMVKEKIGCKTRSVELNVCQRCASHIASLTDIEESVRTGATGVTSAVAGATGVMVCAVRSEGEYAIDFVTKEIASIANAIKDVPADYINEAGNYVTDKCIDYILPLIAGEVDTKYVHGLPAHLTI